MDLFLKLLIGHVICDFTGLQGEFIANGKSRLTAYAGIPFIFPLAAHALIHAGSVWYITQSKFLMSFEFITHFIIDFMKCEGFFTFVGDQVMHTCVLVMIVILYSFL